MQEETKSTSIAETIESLSMKMHAAAGQFKKIYPYLCAVDIQQWSCEYTLDDSSSHYPVKRRNNTETGDVAVVTVSGNYWPVYFYSTVAGGLKRIIPDPEGNIVSVTEFKTTIYNGVSFCYGTSLEDAQGCLLMLSALVKYGEKLRDQDNIDITNVQTACLTDDELNSRMAALGRSLAGLGGYLTDLVAELPDGIVARKKSLPFLNTNVIRDDGAIVPDEALLIIGHRQKDHCAVFMSHGLASCRLCHGEGVSVVVFDGREFAPNVDFETKTALIEMFDGLVTISEGVKKQVMTTYVTCDKFSVKTTASSARQIVKAAVSAISE